MKVDVIVCNAILSIVIDVSGCTGHCFPLWLLNVGVTTAISGFSGSVKENVEVIDVF